MSKRIFALAMILMAHFAVLGEDAIRVRVKKIMSGDTILVHDPRGRDAIVWIDGIAAPESRQAYAARSKYALRNLISMRTVLIVPREYDGRGAIIGRVMLGDLDVGLEQVRRGMAWFDDSSDAFEDPRERASYASAQERARREGLGLWRAEHPVPPWEYRRYRR